MRKLTVQWFPGHMVKAKRMIAEELKLIDVVVEMLDARIPKASSNPLLLDLLGTKTRIVVLNKSDLADSAVTEKWLGYYAQKNIAVVLFDAAKGTGMKRLLGVLQETALPLREKWLARGVKNKSVRVMVAGIPNVGKSSLINRFLNSSKVKTADKPGVTRGKQWLRAGNNLEILDTPGILWPKFEDPQSAFSLAVTGAVKDAVFDVEEAALSLIEFLVLHYPVNIAQRYVLPLPLPERAEDSLRLIAAKKGCLRPGGIVDTETTAKLLLTEFRTGLLGRISLETAKEE